jgi:hypothetical protein
MREKLLTDNADARFTESMTDNANKEPNLATPNKDR